MTSLAWFGLGCVVFLAAAAYDLAAAHYLRAFNDKAPMRSANWGVCTYAVGLVGLAGVLKISPWFCLPEALGLWVGTYLGVWCNNRAKC